MFRKHLICIICIVTIVLMLGTEVFADTAYGFEIEPFDEAEIQSRWNRINLQKEDWIGLLADLNASVLSFDIAENGWCVLALWPNDIFVLNEQNEAVAYFSVSNLSLTHFYVEWYGENILLFTGKGATTIVEFSLNGQRINMVDINRNHVKNKRLYQERTWEKQRVQIGDVTYEMRNNMGVLNLFRAHKYSQVVKIDVDGSESLLYDANRVLLVQTLIRTLIWSCIVIGVLTVFAYQIWKYKRNHR